MVNRFVKKGLFLCMMGSMNLGIGQSIQAINQPSEEVIYTNPHFTNLSPGSGDFTGPLDPLPEPIEEIPGEELIEQVELKVDGNQASSFASLKHSTRSSLSSSIVLFEADLSQCRIGFFDSLSINRGEVDFLPVPGAFDFACSALPEGGIQVTPANGQFFTVSVPENGEDGPVPRGEFDHIKFLALSLYNEAPLKGELITTWKGSGKQLHVKNHPFGQAVINPFEDCRLACAGWVSMEPALLVNFNWLITNNLIYALVERLPGFENLFGYYAAYTYAIPVAKRQQPPLKDTHTFQTSYNRKKGRVTWNLDGEPVFQITQIGHRLTEKNAFTFTKKGRKKPLYRPTRFQLLELGGIDQDLDPIGLQSGIGLFTYLDGYLPNNTNGLPNLPLVRLESNRFRQAEELSGFYYNNPLLAAGQESQFVENSVLDSSQTQYPPLIPSIFRLFGQGAELRLFKFRVTIEE